MKIEKIMDYLDISTHTPHARRDTNATANKRHTYKFQLTRLMRGVTPYDGSKGISYQISTHTPHARRDFYGHAIGQRLVISTHTPHARRDRLSCCLCS